MQSENSSNRPRRTPTQARAYETRARILEKARLAFAEYGFDAANVRDIASDAGTTHSMIRYHFGTKDQLWRETVRDMFEHLSATIEKLNEVGKRDKLTEREMFRRFVRSYVQYCAEHPEHARITIMESIRGGERFSWMVSEFVAPAHREGQRDFERMVRTGLLPSMPYPSYIYALVGMAQLPFVLAREASLALQYDFLSEEAINRHADAVYEIMVSPEPAEADRQSD